MAQGDSSGAVKALNVFLSEFAADGEAWLQLAKLHIDALNYEVKYPSLLSTSTCYFKEAFLFIVLRLTYMHKRKYIRACIHTCRHTDSNTKYTHTYRCKSAVHTLNDKGKVVITRSLSFYRSLFLSAAVLRLT